MESSDTALRAPGERAPLGWRAVTTFVVSVLGLGVSIYLTLVHFSTSLSLACPLGSALINCEKVTTSPQSYIFHIPVSVLGLGFFVSMIVLCSPPAWRSPDRRIALSRVASSVIGIVVVLYLVHAELFEIHAICLWCTSVHVLTLIIFIATVTSFDRRDEGFEDEVEAST